MLILVLLLVSFISVMFHTGYLISLIRVLLSLYVHIHVLMLVLLRFQKFCCRSVSVGFARKTAVFGSVSVFVCPFFPLSSMWYVYAAHCTSNLQQYVTYICV